MVDTSLTIFVGCFVVFGWFFSNQMASSENSSYNVNKYVASTALLLKFYFTYSTDSFLLWRWWKLTQEICVVCTLIVHKFSRQEWSVRSETILSVLISNIPFFCLFRQKPTIDVHTQFFKATSLFWLQQQWPVARGPRILLDLVSTHFLARSDLFPFSSSVYIPARLYLSNPLLLHWGTELSNSENHFQNIDAFARSRATKISSNQVVILIDYA